MNRRAIRTIAVLAAMICGLMAARELRAQVTFTNTSFADAFLATGSPSNPAGTDLTDLNYGAAGILVVASAASVNGEFQSVMQFDLSGATNLFNTTYGVSNWTVSGISLRLDSNYGATGDVPDNPLFPIINGGQFVIEWLSDNNWVEGTGTPRLATMDGVTYDSLPGLLSGAHEILCTNTYTPPGDNVPVNYALPLDTNIMNEVMSGGDVSLLFHAADDQIAYLFNSHNFGGVNVPLIQVTAKSTHPQILAGYFTNANFHLTGLGNSSAQYQVQATTNLAGTPWQTLGIVNADGAGMIQFDDTSAAGLPQRFYRISQ